MSDFLIHRERKKERFIAYFRPYFIPTQAKMSLRHNISDTEYDIFFCRKRETWKVTCERIYQNFQSTRYIFLQKKRHGEPRSRVKEFSLVNYFCPYLHIFYTTDTLVIIADNGDEADNDDDETASSYRRRHGGGMVGGGVNSDDSDDEEDNCCGGGYAYHPPPIFGWTYHHSSHATTTKSSMMLEMYHPAGHIPSWRGHHPCDIVDMPPPPPPPTRSFDRSFFL